MAKRPINGVPHPKMRGVRLPAPDPASQRAQRVYGPGGGGGGGGGGKPPKKGCALLVLALAALPAATTLATLIATRS